MSVAFVVHGLPAPQGSKRHVGNGVMIESSKAVKPWREAVKAAAIGKVQTPMTGAVDLNVVFYFKRPKSHYRTGKNAHLLKADAPQEYKSSTPDLSKLIRSTEDALTDASLWGDDAQVAFVHSRKVYSDFGWQGAQIVVRQLDA